MTQSTPNVKQHSCDLCDAGCGLNIEVEHDQVVSIAGDPDDVFSHGYLCPKARAMADLHDDPDRLHRPIRKHGSEWQEVEWDEAFDFAAERLNRIQGAHGADAVASYIGNPVTYNVGSLLNIPNLFMALGSRNRYTASSVDIHANVVANILCFGNGLLGPVPDVDRTDLFVMLGANPAVSNGSYMTAPGIGKRLAAITERGGDVILIDPRRTETARIATEHHFIRPSTDVHLISAMIRHVLERGPSLGRLQPLVRWLEALRAAVEPFTPDACAAVTGIAASTVTDLADRLLTTERALVYGRMGISTQTFAGLTAFLLHALNTLCGNLDRPGAMMFANPAVDLRKPPPGSGIITGSYGNTHSRVRGLPDVNGEFPLATLADEILTPGDGQVRGLITVAGNPALSCPDGRRMETSLASLDTLVCVDFYLNETTRHADVILPPVSGLQRCHYDLFGYHYAVRNIANYSDPVLPMGPDERHDSDILAELCTRLAIGRKGRFSPLAVQMRLSRRLGTERTLDGLLRMGAQRIDGKRVTVKALRARPHGVDFGPLEPELPRLLPRKHRYIDLAPDPILADLSRAQAALTQQPPALVLIGRRQLRNDNSWLHNSARLMTGKDRCTLLVHPDDAAERGLVSGDRATLTSRVGSAELPIEVTDAIAPGVVSLPHGFGHDRPGTKLTVAQATPGVSANDLTDASEVDPLSGAAVLNGVPVELATSAPATLAHSVEPELT